MKLSLPKHLMKRLALCIALAIAAFTILYSCSAIRSIFFLPSAVVRGGSVDMQFYLEDSLSRNLLDSGYKGYSTLLHYLRKEDLSFEFLCVGMHTLQTYYNTFVQHPDVYYAETQEIERVIVNQLSSGNPKRAQAALSVFLHNNLLPENSEAISAVLQLTEHQDQQVRYLAQILSYHLFQNRFNREGYHLVDFSQDALVGFPQFVIHGVLQTWGNEICGIVDKVAKARKVDVRLINRIRRPIHVFFGRRITGIYVKKI